MLGIVLTGFIAALAVGAVVLAVIFMVKNRGRCTCCKDNCAGCSGCKYTPESDK